MPRDAASNETLRLAKIVLTPDRDWALASTSHEQHAESIRAALRPRGTRDNRLPNQRWNYKGVPQDAINEHDHLSPWRLCFILGAPTSGVTPQKLSAAERVIHEYRVCSFEYLCRHFVGRLAHIVLKLECALASDLAADPVLRCVKPFGAALRNCGVLDWTPHGVFNHALSADRDASHRAFQIDVGGVTRLQWPASALIGDCLYILLIADVYWESEGPNSTLGTWLDERAIDPQATASEIHAHAAYGRGALSRWLDRSPSEYQYAPEDLADYEAIRAQAMAPATSAEERERLNAAAKVGVRQPLRVTRFRLRAESFPRGSFGDPRYAGSAGATTPPPRLDLKVGRGMAECVVSAFVVGAVMQRGAHVASGTKRSRTMPAWGSAAEDDRLAVYNHDYLTAKLGWMELISGFDVERYARIRARWGKAFAALVLVALLARVRRRRVPVVEA